MFLHASQQSGQVRRGFTLVELLVVIAIIGVLVALLLPAVQAARESARRMQCSNNVKQIMLSLHNFHDTYLVLPPGSVKGGTVLPVHSKFNIPKSVNHGWGAFILPFMEQQPLYDRYRWDVSWTDPANLQVVEVPLKTFICPSSPIQKRYETTPRAAASDYGALNGVAPAGLNPLGVLDPGTNTNPEGVMRPNEIIRFAEITDGTSNTFWIDECAGRPTAFTRGRKRGGVQGSLASSVYSETNEHLIHGVAYSGSGNGPYVINASNGDEMFSFHPNGAMAGFGDGSVRFLNENLDTRVITSLNTRAGGELVQLP